jgi:hypothetical protein
MTRSRDVADTQDNLGGAVAPFVAGKNALINGGQDIWQRGTSFTTTAAYTYCSDRWYYSTSSGGKTASRQLTSDTTNLPTIQYCTRLARNSGQTDTTGFSFHTALETISSIPFAGQKVTFSFYARKGADFSGTTVATYINTGTGTDQAASGQNSGTWTGFTSPLNGSTFTPTTTWTRYSFNATIGATAREIGLGFLTSAFSGTAGAADYLEFTGLQLELGSVTTPFARTGGSIGGELALCQRYYFRVNAFATSQYAIFGAGAGNSTTQARTIVPFPATMRAKPSAVDFPTLGSNFSIIAYDDSMNVAPTGLILDGNQTDTQSGYLLWNTSSGVVANRPCVVRGLATTGAYVGFTAEL